MKILRSVAKFHFLGEHFLEGSAILVLGGQTCLCLYAAIWPLRVRSCLWGRLMHRYAVGLEKMDVARGHCVPAPPFEVVSGPRSGQHWMSNAR